MEVTRSGDFRNFASVNISVPGILFSIGTSSVGRLSDVHFAHFFLTLFLPIFFISFLFSFYFVLVFSGSRVLPLNGCPTPAVASFLFLSGTHTNTRTQECRIALRLMWLFCDETYVPVRTTFRIGIAA